MTSGITSLAFIILHGLLWKLWRKRCKIVTFVAFVSSEILVKELLRTWPLRPYWNFACRFWGLFGLGILKRVLFQDDMQTEIREIKRSKSRVFFFIIAFLVLLKNNKSPLLCQTARTHIHDLKVKIVVWNSLKRAIKNQSENDCNMRYFKYTYICRRSKAKK